jgi:hypothetical protein
MILSLLDLEVVKPSRTEALCEKIGADFIVYRARISQDLQKFRFLLSVLL